MRDFIGLWKAADVEGGLFFNNAVMAKAAAIHVNGMY